MTASRTVGPRRKVSRQRQAAVATLALAFGLRAWQLGAKSLWWDEALAVWALRKPLADLTAWTAGDVHPPLFFWLHWLWRPLAGESPFALRFPGLLWGVLTVALALALGRRAAGPAAGAWAALLVAVAPFAVWWSQELRMYALAGLWTALAAYAAWRWLDEAGGPARPAPAGGAQVGIPSPSAPTGGPSRAWPWLAAYTLAATALLHSLYLGAAALVALNVAVGLRWLRRRPGRGGFLAWSAAQLLVLVAFLPWWRYASERMQSWSSIRHPAGPAEVLELAAILLATGRSVDLAQAAPAAALFWGALATAAGHLLWRRRLPAGAAFLLVPALLPLAAIWAATQPRSLFYSPGLEARYFYAFASAAWVLIAALLAALRPAGRGPSGLLAATLLGPLLGSLPTYYAPRRLRDELQSLSLSLWSQARPDDALLLVSGDRYPLLEASYGQVRSPELPSVLPFPGRAAGPLPADWEDRLAEAVRGRDRVWLVELERHWQDPEGRIGDWLAERYRQTFGAAYGTADLRLFSSQEAAPLRVERVDAAWPGCRDLSGGAPTRPARGGRGAQDRSLVACLPAATLLPGDPLNLSLFEQGSTRPALALGPAGEAELPLVRWPEEPGDAAGWSLRQRRLTVGDRWPAGPYAFRLDGQALALPHPPFVRSPEASVPSWPVGWEALDLRFAAGDGLPGPRLTGIALTGGPPRPGARLAIDLRWELSGPLPADRRPTVFVHALSAPRPDGSPVWAGSDGLPAGGSWPDSGGPLLDRHLLILPSEAPPRPYQLEIGLYDAAGGLRWPVRGLGADIQNRRVLWPIGLSF